MREIGHVRSSTFCAALITRIQPAVAGILANDGALEQGYRGLQGMASDVVPKAASDKAAVALDRMLIDRSISAMTHNLSLVDGVLKSPATSNVATPTASPEPLANDSALLPLQDQLRYLAIRQHQALDVLSGTVETDRLSEMQHDLGAATQVAGVVGIPLQGSLAVSSNASIASAGLPRAPSDAIDLRAIEDTHIFGNPSSRQAAVVQAYRINIDAHERTASAQLADAVSACGGTNAPRPAKP